MPRWVSSSARVDDPERCTSSVAAASRGRADARNDIERAQRPPVEVLRMPGPFIGVRVLVRPAQLSLEEWIEGDPIV